MVAKLENRCSSAEGAEERERGKVERLERDKAKGEEELQEVQREVVDIRQTLEEETNRKEAVENELGEALQELESYGKFVDEQKERLAQVEKEARETRDRLAEKEKELGALKSEADLDRAVLEKELESARESLEAKAKDIEQHEGRNRTLEDIADGLREQVGRWETVVKSKEEDAESLKKEIETTRMDKEKGIVDVQKELVRAQRQARAAVIVAAKLRDDNDNITRALNTPPPPKPEASTSSTAAELDRAATPSSTAISQVSSTPAPSLEYASRDIDELLAELEQVDHVPLTDAIRNKMDGLTTLTKKWVKEAKAYRERAHRATSGATDKIAFRQ